MNKKVSLVIPVYNEAEHLERFLAVIDELQLPAEKELIFVNDCSRDSSKQILESYPFKSSVKLINHEFNKGKGAALRTGIDAASGEIIGIQDADFEYDPTEIPSLVEPLVNDKADVVYGSRFKRTNQVHRTIHYLGNRVLTLFSNLCSGLYLSDMETCYKFFRADIIKNTVLESNRFGFEPEITAKIAKLKLRVMEFPISYFPRNYLEGKKITWKDGVAALRHIIYFSFFRSLGESFKGELPTRFIPKGGNWL
jgi:glycosyltransferase involved in cell wall biosynthesis